MENKNIEEIISSESNDLPKLDEISVQEEINDMFLEEIDSNFNLKEVIHYVSFFIDNFLESLDGFDSKIDQVFDEMIENAGKDYEDGGYFDKWSYSPINTVREQKRDGLIAAVNIQKQELKKGLGEVISGITLLQVDIQDLLNNYDSYLADKGEMDALIQKIFEGVKGIIDNVNVLSSSGTGAGPFDNLTFVEEMVIFEKEKRRILLAIDNIKIELESFINEVKDNVMIEINLNKDEFQMNLEEDLNNMLGTGGLSMDQMIELFKVIQEWAPLFLKLDLSSIETPNDLFNSGFDGVEGIAHKSISDFQKSIESIEVA